jgi:predicted nucleic acid-binding protein
MDLVIDANILMSALIATQGTTFDLLFNPKLRLFSIEKLLAEVEKHKDRILDKSGLSESDLEVVITLVSAEINFVPYVDFKKFIPESREISPDQDDTEYFACALSLRCAIWSNDKRLKDQDKVQVLSTGELLGVIST